MDNTCAEWYRSTAMLFFIAAIWFSIMAFFSIFDDWFGIGKDLYRVILMLGAICALNSGAYYYLARGKCGAFLSMKLNQIHFWVTVMGPFVLLLYYGQLTRTVQRANYANYPLFRGRLSGVLIFAEIIFGLGELAFLINVIQAAAQEKRARAVA